MNLLLVFLLSRMDGFLDFLGLYRSDVAKDESCLFRALSEQLFYTQIYNENLKDDLLKFMRRNKAELDCLVEDWDTHLEKLEENQIWAGLVEMSALSLKFRIDFNLYTEVGQLPKKITRVDSGHPIDLAAFPGNRFDCVYSKSYLAASAICQSITYELLYKNIFKFGEDVDVAVEKMLHDKNYSKQRKNQNLAMRQGSEERELELSLPECEQTTQEDPSKELKKALAQGMPPFPYKVAKTLDKHIYRNVEFDIWNEQKKETLKNEQYVKPTLALGVKCKVKLASEGVKTCHVQDFDMDGQVIVFIEGIGHMCSVAKDDLEVIPIPPYKPLTWQGGKTYRVSAEGRYDGDRKFRRKCYRRSENTWAQNSENYLPASSNSEDMSTSKENSSPEKQRSFFSSTYKSPSKEGKYQNTGNNRSKQNTIPKKCYKGPFHFNGSSNVCDINCPMEKEAVCEQQYVPNCPISAPRRPRHELFFEPGSFPPPYPPPPYQNVADYSPDGYSPPVLAYNSPPPQNALFYVAPQSCDPQVFTNPQDVIQFGAYGSAAATSMPLQIPAPGYMRANIEDIPPPPINVPPPSQAMTVMSYPVYPGYIVYNSDVSSNSLPVSYLPSQCAPAANEHPPSIPGFYMNTPPGGISPSVPHFISGYGTTPSPPQVPMSLPQAMSAGCLACSPTLMNEMNPYQAAIMSPPWSPQLQSSNVISAGQPTYQCQVPGSIITQHPYAFQEHTY